MTNKPKLPDRTDATIPSKEILGRIAEEYKKAKEFAESTAKRADELKKELVRQVSQYGTSDDRGHKWMAAGDMQLKHERRVGKSFDLASAIDWAKENDIWDAVKEIIETTNEDLILRYSWEHPEHQATVAKFYVERETWAFKLIDQKSYDDE